MTYIRRGLRGLPVLRNFLHKPRLLIAIACGTLIYVLTLFFSPFRAITCGLISWNTCTLIYLSLALKTMLGSSQQTMRKRAALHDETESSILIISTVAAVLSLAAIIAELSTAKSGDATFKSLHIGISALTLVTSWCFIHTAFAFHYAHGYYADLARGQTPCLIIPGDPKTPPYTDFLYFSFIIGTSGQTADIGLASSEMRRIGLIHCVLSYLFNATVLALTINIAASLI